MDRAPETSDEHGGTAEMKTTRLWPSKCTYGQLLLKAIDVLVQHPTAVSIDDSRRTCVRSSRLSRTKAV